MLTLLATLSTAHACGGLFCNTLAPVDQTEEAIVFAVDPVAETTTMHVQIGYEGPAEEFAWVLPIPGVPDVRLTRQQLFDRLAAHTRPRFDVVSTAPGCSDEWGFDSEGDADADTDVDTDTDTDADTDSDFPVLVVSTARVGAYETVVLTATDATALQSWLQENGYGVPDGTDEALAPYLGGDTHFLALKLASDAPAGDLAPLAIAFPGVEAAIPMRLTALAVAPDMPVTTYVLGASRAVPANYLHMDLNPLRADWETGSIFGHTSRAADEAGGRAFTTTYANRPQLDSERADRERIEALANATSAEGWITAMAGLGAIETVDDLLAVIALPDGTNTIDFFNCPDCYPSILDGLAFDAQAWTATFLTEVYDPMVAIDLLLHESYVTRLDTTLSASEMTVDPRFRFAGDLPTVSNVHRMELTRTCRFNQDSYEVPYEVVVDGFRLFAPSQRTLDARGIGLYDWLATVSPSETLTIASFGEVGFEVLLDNEPSLRDRIAQVDTRREVQRNEGVFDASPTGCSTVGSHRLLGALPFLAMAVRRRRSGFGAQ